jgi:ammonia channel protein AmtB
VVRNTLEIAGLVAITAGAYLILPPLALLVVGVLVVVAVNR